MTSACSSSVICGKSGSAIVSLSAMTLVAAIEDEFDVRLSTAEIISMRNVGTVRAILQAKGVAEP